MKPQILDTIDLINILGYMKRKVGEGSPNAFTARQLMISRVLHKKIYHALSYEEVLEYLMQTGYLTKLSKKEDEIKPRYALEVDRKKLKHTKPLYALKIDPKKLKNMNPHIVEIMDLLNILGYMKRKVDEGNPNSFTVTQLLRAGVLGKKIHDALGYEEVLHHLKKTGYLQKLRKKEDERKPRYALEVDAKKLKHMKTLYALKVDPEKLKQMTPQIGDPIDALKLLGYMKRKVGQGSSNAFSAAQLLRAGVLEKKIHDAFSYDRVLHHLTKTGHLQKLRKKENERKPRYALKNIT